MATASIINLKQIYNTTKYAKGEGVRTLSEATIPLTV